MPWVPEAFLSTIPTLPPEAATSATSPNCAVLRNFTSDRFDQSPPPGDHTHCGEVQPAAEE